MKKKKKKRNSKAKIILKKILLAVIPLLLIAAVILTAVLLIFRVRNISVENAGKLNYSVQEIVSAAHSAEGKNLLKLDTEKLADDIERALPKIENIEIKRKYPDTVIIAAKNSKNVFAVQTASEAFALLTGSLRVTDIAGKIPESAILIKGAGKSAALSPGDVLSSNAETSSAVITETAKAIKASKFSKINLVNIEKKDNIYLIYDGRILIKIGNADNIGKKISLAKKSINKENELSPSQYGVLDVSDTPKAVFAPKNYNDIPELEEYDEEIKDYTGEEEKEENTSTKTDAGKEETTVNAA